MRLDVVGVCEPCEPEGAPLLALRRRDGNQSPLSLRLRRPQPRVTSVLPLLERGMWNSPGEPRVTLRNTSTASNRHSCAMPRRFSNTIFTRTEAEHPSAYRTNDPIERMDVLLRRDS